MNKLYIIFFLFFATLSLAQKPLQKSYYGGVFTPKGHLKALVVPVIFKDGGLGNPAFRNANNYLAGWELKKGHKLPDAVNPLNGDCPQWLFNRPEHFETDFDSVFINDSKLFYTESKGKFLFMAELFKDSTGKPVTIEIDPDGGRDWSHNNKKAFDEMKRINPSFDWAAYDSRTNRPNYLFDNSEDPKPDSVVDYIIFIYRYSTGWAEQPTLGMNRWAGSGGGYAAANGIGLERYNGYKFMEGFTMMWGSGVFVHEIAHTLFNAPHLFGSNNTVGNYFYRPSVSWGTMNTIPVFQNFNAWERWYMGFNDILYDITSEVSLEQGNEFILNDYYTTGDAMRIEIPFSGGQHLWIENRTKLHRYDEHAWKGFAIGADTIATTPAGLYLYTEAVGAKQEQIISVLSDICNGIRPLNAAGNYDYSYTDELPEKNAWANNLYKFKKLNANSLSGTNPYFFYRADFNKNGTIDLDVNYNAARNEGEPINRQEMPDGSYRNLYHNFGVYDTAKDADYTRSPAFGSGDVLDMGSNPTISNYQRYEQNKQCMAATYLNGLKISFFKVSNNRSSIKVRVEFKQTALNNNVRWCGNIILPNITADSLPDLVLQPRIELLLDKSGTANRHTLTAAGDFINPTHFKIATGATLYMKKRSRIVVEKGTTLELEKGARLIMDKNTKIIIRPSAQLILNGNNIERHSKSNLTIEGLLKN